MNVVVERGAATDAGWPQVVCAGNLTAVNLFCKKACRSLRFFVHLSKNGFPKRRRASDHLNRPAVEKLICPPLCFAFIFLFIVTMLFIFCFFVAHWYLSLFAQTFFLHRYAAHKSFTMSRNWERFFFILSYITQGSSYLSPWAYGIMHRMHHAFTDTEHDPHSPAYDKNLFAMMWRTKEVYQGILYQTIPVEQKFTKNVPEWRSFDLLASHNISRLLWAGLYVWIYVAYAPYWWLFLLLPVHILMGPVHGVIINWFAHIYGGVNFATDNTSRNLFKLDLLMLGEGYHNNHHAFPASSNFAVRQGEFDFCYPIIKMLHRIGVIRMTNVPGDGLRR